jgi:hypothetical protein
MAEEFNNMRSKVQRKEIKATSSITNGSTTRSEILDGPESLEGTSISIHNSSLDMGLQLRIVEFLDENPQPLEPQGFENK